MSKINKIKKICFILSVFFSILLYQNCSNINLNPLQVASTNALTCKEDSAQEDCINPLPPTCDGDPSQPHCEEEIPPPQPQHPYRFTTPNNTTFQAGSVYTLTWVPPNPQDTAQFFPGCGNFQIRFLTYIHYNAETGTTLGYGDPVISNAIATDNYIATYSCSQGNQNITLDQITIRVNNPLFLNPNTLRITTIENSLLWGAVNRNPITEIPTGVPHPDDSDFAELPTFRTRWPLVTRRQANGSLEIDVLSVRIVAPAIASGTTYGQISQNLDNGQITMFFSKVPGDLNWSATRSGCSIVGIDINWRLAGMHVNASDRCALTPGEEYYLNMTFIDLPLARQGNILGSCIIDSNYWNNNTLATCDYWGRSGLQ